MKLKRILAAILCAALLLASLCSCDLESVFNNLPYTVIDDYTPDLLVHFLDVGQGDSAFIEFPNGETMLIDTGENYHGEGLVRYIERCGHDRIDYLVGTHPHSDHIGSMGYLIRNFKIGSIYMPKVGTNTELYESILKSVSQKELTVKNPKAGLKIVRNEDFSVRVIGPQEYDEDNLNNSSLVLRLDYKDASFLFMGDAEREELESLSADLSADVLKVGHHGSANATTQEFLDKVKPQIAVISCGENNEYGHPHRAVTALLKQANCDVYRTDKNGTITVYTDGTEIGVATDGASIERVR